MLALAAAAPAQAAPPHGGHGRAPAFTLPFIENDFARAMASGRETRRPVFVEMWAPWCHSCRSMRAFVFTDSALAPHASRFVWLSLDTEAAVNAALRKRLKLSAVPTYFIMDPDSERIAIRWVGGASVAQLVQLLSDGEAAVRGGTAASPAYQALVEADRLYAREEHAAAAEAFARALAAAPADWPAYARAVESRMFALSSAGLPEPAVRQAIEAWPRLAATPSAAALAAYALDASLELPDSLPERAATIARFEAQARSVVSEGARFAADDRSGVYFSLEAAREAVGDTAGARALMREHLAMLDREAAAATTPHQRTVFDSHRVSLAMELGTFDTVVASLLQSERDFPDDYNPPARLALAYKAMRRWEDARAASDRALERVYGPRQFVVLDARIALHRDMGDAAGVRQWVTESLRRARAMPADQRSERTIARYEKQLAELAAK